MAFRPTPARSLSVPIFKPGGLMWGALTSPSLPSEPHPDILLFVLKRSPICAQDVLHELRLGRPPEMPKTLLVRPASPTRGTSQLHNYYGRLRSQP